MVGPGLHRVDQRGAGAPRSSRATSSRRCPPTSASTTCACPRPGRRRATSRARTASRRSCYWHYWFGDGDRILERPFREVLDQRRARRRVLPRLGEPDVDRHLARRRRPGAEAADATPAPRTTGATSTTLLPAFRDERYLRVTAARCSTSSGPRSCPMPRRSSTGGRRMAREAGLDGLYLVAEASDLLGRGPRYTRRRSRRLRRRACTCGCPPRSTAATTLRDAGACASCMRRSRGLAVLRHDRRRLPASAPTSSRACTPTGTTRRGRVARGLAVQGATPERFQRNVERPSHCSPDRPPRSGCSGSSRGTSGPRATTSSPTCVHGHGWLRGAARRAVVTAPRHPSSATARCASR